MQGILIVSIDAAVRQSLGAILQGGRTVRECRSISESLALAAAEKLDFIFVDDIFADGTAAELVERLHTLGYGPEIVPITPSLDGAWQAQFQPYGVRHCLAKPFNLAETTRVVNQIEEILRLGDGIIEQARRAAISPLPTTLGERFPNAPGKGDDVDVREVSQRFRRLLARLRKRHDLVRAFADSLQEQFDVDNVVILLPAANRPVFEVAHGSIAEDVRAQFFISMDEPLLKLLGRLGEPVWVYDDQLLGRHNALSAIRCGERLNIQVLCPVLLRGRLKAIVGLSRFHRYNGSLALISLLRLFLTFFAEALENSDLYQRLSNAGDIFRAIFDSLDVGAAAIAKTGDIAYVNPPFAALLGIAADELADHPVERAGSLLAHCAHEVLATGAPARPRTIAIRKCQVEITALPMRKGDLAIGALLLLREKPSHGQPAAPPPSPAAPSEQLWRNMAQTVAHNFKNAFVPIQTCAELLPSRFADPEFRNLFIGSVIDNIARLDAWIGRLQSFAQIGDNDAWCRLPFQDILAQAVAQARHNAPHLDWQSNSDIPPASEVAGSRPVLVKMLLELLTNASEAVAAVEQPQVTIAASQQEKTIVVTIQDNGPGLDPAIQARLFEPFATGKLSGSLGLGLAYVKRAVEAHGGTITLNTNPTGPTTAELRLPLAPHASQG